MNDAAINESATLNDAEQLKQEESEGAKLSVRHRTTFHYASLVKGSTNTLRLEPRDFRLQRTISALIRIIPATRLLRFVDLFENINHHFELISDHSKLIVESTIKVQNLKLDLTMESREALLTAYGDPSIRERTWQFLQDSRRVTLSPEIWRMAMDLTNAQGPVFQQVNKIMAWIWENFAYDTQATNVQTEVSEVLLLRRGVCQDFTHLMLGMCRSIGIPTRYASGYIFNGARESLVGAQASHAWCEVYLAGTGWIGFDPTNNMLADERYVKIAVGRDYEDVAPIKGYYTGTAHSRLEVEVTVEKL